MIEMLIKDNDIHINDIIRQSFQSRETSKSPELINYENFECLETQSNKAASFNAIPSTAKISHKKGSSGGSCSSAGQIPASQTTNVWQERAAFREMQKGV